MSEKIKILILEDVPLDAELMEYELRHEGIDFISRLVESKEDFIRELEEFKPELILADHSLPQFD
ncbi:MAG: response regulator, partial [Actinobacteria bacterium]|nr:response regulator [Actinomycetota bacterium]MBM4241489.1 response regulator [Euryarchaeota archaeon]